MRLGPGQPSRGPHRVLSCLRLVWGAHLCSCPLPSEPPVLPGRGQAGFANCVPQRRAQPASAQGLGQRRRGPPAWLRLRPQRPRSAQDTSRDPGGVPGGAQCQEGRQACCTRGGGAREKPVLQEPCPVVGCAPTHQPALPRLCADSSLGLSPGRGAMLALSAPWPIFHGSCLGVIPHTGCGCRRPHPEAGGQEAVCLCTFLGLSKGWLSWARAQQLGRQLLPAPQLPPEPLDLCPSGTRSAPSPV